MGGGWYSGYPYYWDPYNPYFGSNCWGKRY